MNRKVAIAALNNLAAPDEMRSIWVADLRDDVMKYIKQIEQERDQLKEQMSAESIISDSYREERDRYKDELKEVKAQLPPVENGRNRYGLDVSYFRNLINRELNRGLADYKPDELARICLRMAMTADKTVINEREFISRMNLAQHDAEVIASALYDLSTAIRYDFTGVYALGDIEEFIDNYIDQLRQKAQEQ